MTAQQAKIRLTKLRLQARAIRQEISLLRAIIIAEGINPEHADNSERNTAIFEMRSQGASFTQVAKYFGLSAGLISKIVARVVKEKRMKP